MGVHADAETPTVSAVQYRFLGIEDINEVKSLCMDFFPVKYPESWFVEITSNPRFFSLAATVHGKIVGLLVSKVRRRSEIHPEDDGLLSSRLSCNQCQVSYILSLGVVIEWRRLGIASQLLDRLLNHLDRPDMESVKCVYLHVLTSNTGALNFYESKGFSKYSFLPFYYVIDDARKDGFCYVLYINGGEGPRTISDYLKSLTSTLSNLQVCSIPSSFIRGATNWIRKLLPSFTQHKIGQQQ